MAKADPVTKAAKSAPVGELATLLGALVKVRRQRPARTTQPIARPTPSAMPSTAATRTARRSARRIGRIRFYTATAKLDVSRFGTFRKYMINTIRAHSNTRAANEAHALCTEPKYAKNKLDFNWAADNGFITWDA